MVGPSLDTDGSSTSVLDRSFGTGSPVLSGKAYPYSPLSHGFGQTMLLSTSFSAVSLVFHSFQSLLIGLYITGKETFPPTLSYRCHQDAPPIDTMLGGDGP